MISTKEKAKELVDKFINVNYLKDYEGMHIPLAKQCALITVNELIKETGSKYYYYVKQEIEKL